MLLAWKAIMTYWLPEQALMGKRPVLLAKSLLSGFVTTKLGLKALQWEEADLLEAPACGHFDIAGQDGP